jgi:signal transduction histidine kinase
MALSVAAVSAIAWWDSQHESEALLGDVAREQSMVAAILSSSLRAHLVVLEHEARRLGEGGPAKAPDPDTKVTLRAPDAPPPAPHDTSELVFSLPVGDRMVDLTLHARDLLDVPPEISPPGELEVFVAPPHPGELFATDARVASASVAPDGVRVLRDALDRGAATARLDRQQAAGVGLLARTAMAGLARIDVGTLGQWAVVTVGTAAHPRDRETRAFWRLVLGVGLSAGLVLAFGGVALRNQRKELELERELAVEQAQREREEQLARAERVATMGTFAMGVMHEVSTPLGVISGRAEQLRTRVDSDERAIRAVETIMAQVDRIQGVIRRFLDLARGGPPTLTRIAPGDLVRSAASFVEHRFAKAGVSLAIDASLEPSEVHCDRALLEQAVVNLLLNACDACAPGGRVELSVRADAESVAFVVTDDGAGITPEAAARAADPFFTTKPAGAGTGLGLAIASEIAKSHRGELTVAPNAGRGTRACIELPAVLQNGAG